MCGLAARLAGGADPGRIRREFADDLDSRSGQRVTVALCAELTSYPDYARVLYEPACQEARELLGTLFASAWRPIAHT